MFRVRVLMTVVLMFTAIPVYAGDTDTFGIGARSSALGGAVSASANDPFAVYYNPACLSLIDGQMLSLGVTVLQPDIRFNDYHVSHSGDSVINGNKTFSDQSDPLYAPSIGYAGKINEKMTFGCAAYAPWGLQIKMSDDPAKNPGAYNAYESYYTRAGVTPSLAYKISPKLSVGFGMTLGRSTAGGRNRMYVSSDMGSDFPEYGAQMTALINNASAVSQSMGGPAVTNTAEGAYFYEQASAGAADPATAMEYAQYAYLMDSAYNYGIMTAADTAGKSSPSHNSDMEVDMVDDFNYSFNMGIMYQPTDIISLGLTYRGRCKTDFEGDILVDGVKVSEGHSSYDHPEQVQGGVRFQFPDKKLSIETDVVWTRWSIQDSQDIYLDEGVTVQVVPGVYETTTLLSTARDWNDTVQFRVGVEYLLNDMFTLRAGHFYDPSPIPDKTLDYMHPDADKRTYSVGLGIHVNTWTIDSYFSFTDIEQAREIGGESTNLNNTYNVVNQDSQVSVNASGKIYGAGVTLSRSF